MDSAPLLTDGDGEHADAIRLNPMVTEAAKLACESSSYNEAYLAYMENLKALSEKLRAIIIFVVSTRGPAGETSEVVSNIPVQPQSTLVLDPNISQTKGRKKDAKGKEVAVPSGHIKSGIEIATEKRKRMCKSCGQPARHDSRNCPLNLNKRTRNVEITDDDDDDMEED
ncbi:hypothetical protein Dimus_016343 [Dionaea muscipula]